MQNYVQTHIIIPSIEKIRAHQGVTEELQRELNLTLKKFQSMRKLFCKIFRAVDRFYVNRENDSRRMWYYRENHDRVETIEESVTTIFKTSLDEKLQASEIVKYYCDRWLIEQQNDDTSVEEFTFTTKTKVVEERTMLVKEFGFEDALLAQPGAQDGVTSKCILEQLILRGLEHERNNHGDAEVMMNKFEEVFNVYDRIQKGDQNRFVSHSSSSNIQMCICSLLLLVRIKLVWLLMSSSLSSFTLFFSIKKRSSFIEASKRYYAQIRAQWIGENKSLDIYMKDTEQLLGVEALRISFYIREERWVEEAIEAAKQELVIDYVNEVINPQHSGGKIDHILLL